MAASAEAREPTRADDSQQDVNWVPNEIENTLKGGSAYPGSAAKYPNPGQGGSGYEGEQHGFVGTRHTPDEDEK